MDGVGAGLLRHPDDLGDRQIGGDRPQHLAVGQPTDLVGLVRLEPVEGELVLLGEDRHGGAAELVGGAEDADGDLRAVGDEDLGDRHASPFRGKTAGAHCLAGLCRCEKSVCRCEDA